MYFICYIKYISRSDRRIWNGSGSW